MQISGIWKVDRMSQASGQTQNSSRTIHAVPIVFATPRGEKPFSIKNSLTLESTSWVILNFYEFLNATLNINNSLTKYQYH